MERELQSRFVRLWEEYFPTAELPITFFYADDPGGVECAPRPEERTCVFSQLGGVRKGESVCFDVSTLGCPGAKRCFGFSREIMPDFEYFLSCGIPGKLEGERYKKTPELVRDFMKNAEILSAPGKYIIFKRWDSLTEGDEPDVAIFFAMPDVLAGQFTLANFDESMREAAITPFGAGCASLVQYPLLEKAKARPRAVLGTFDISSRPWVQRDILSFAVPMAKFRRMIDNMEESFLTTRSWAKIRERVRGGKQSS